MTQDFTKWATLGVRYDQYESFDNQFGHLFFEHPYSHYAVLVEYHW